MAASWQRSLLARIAAIGADPRDSSERALQKTLLVGVTLACVMAGVVWSLAYFAIGAPLAAGMPLSYAALSLVSTYALGRSRRFALYRFTQLALILLLPWLMMLSLGGFNNSSAVILWSGLCPLGALVFNELREAVGWLLVFLVLMASSALLAPFAVAPLAPGVIRAFYALNIGGVISIVFLMLFYFVTQKNRFQEKSELLLLNVLPKEIADILKGEQRSIADHFEEASILFADVVQFTPLSRSIEPLALVDLLEEVFFCFDLLVEKHELEKIKTIGDCYMVAAGVPRLRADHAQALARMALDMQAAVAGRTFGGRRLAFRIGMNSGPVVAGVIGRKKFIYDLWGEAVNTASRMESQGVRDTIQITQATYERIKDQFVCESGGMVQIKGMGEIAVWRLIAEKPAAGSGHEAVAA